MGPERVEQAQTDSFLGPVLLVLSDVILGVIGRQGSSPCPSDGILLASLTVELF